MRVDLSCTSSYPYPPQALPKLCAPDGGPYLPTSVDGGHQCSGAHANLGCGYSSTHRRTSEHTASGCSSASAVAQEIRAPLPRFPAALLVLVSGIRSPTTTKAAHRVVLLRVRKGGARAEARPGNRTKVAVRQCAPRRLPRCRASSLTSAVRRSLVARSPLPAQSRITALPVSLPSVQDLRCSAAQCSTLYYSYAWIPRRPPKKCVDRDS
jgi:hypothetical protein